MAIRFELENPERRYDLDWLRVLAVLLLVYFHGAAIFYRGDLGEFYVTNGQPSPTLSFLILLVHQWHMPLFFFLSGAATWFSLEARSVQQYLKERCQRLFLPFVFGTLVLVPPQVYYHQLQTSGDYSSYFQFYPHFFNGIRPMGNFEWAHLWFLIYLFVFTIAALPIFLALKQAQQRLWYVNLSLKLQQSGALFYLALPLAVIEALFRPRWIGFQNLYDDWANVLLYFTYFIYGYVFTSERGWNIIDRQKLVILGAAILGMSILSALWLTDSVPIRSYSPGYILYQAFRGFNTWCWVVALLSLGRSHLNFNHPILRYANEASYPIYLLHQSIIVAIGFYVVNWDIDIFYKFFIISTFGLMFTLVVYELVVRRFNFIRFCFGLKPLAPKT
jgi:peptidoglycan/LPS O-acetylase OafA/YrhL